MRGRGQGGGKLGRVESQEPEDGGMLPGKKERKRKGECPLDKKHTKGEGEMELEAETGERHSRKSPGEKARFCKHKINI